jgi:hypothetical protein
VSATPENREGLHGILFLTVVNATHGQWVDCSGTAYTRDGFDFFIAFSLLRSLGGEAREGRETKTKNPVRPFVG